MTSNAGAGIIQERFEGFDEKDVFKQLDVIDETKNEVTQLLRQTIRPEFLNRIDEIIMFRPLTRREIGKIVNIQFNHVKNLLADNGITLEASPEALAFIGEQGYDPQFGARPLKRVIQRLVMNELSKQILSGKVKKDDVILAILKEGKIEFENESL